MSNPRLLSADDRLGIRRDTERAWSQCTDLIRLRAVITDCVVEIADLRARIATLEVSIPAGKRLAWMGCAAWLEGQGGTPLHGWNGVLYEAERRYPDPPSIESMVGVLKNAATETPTEKPSP